ncbi:hypothetical protein EVAR_94683_1 [Eumeta japonica]|uniref:Uncharacterized protein n=1 Tax=Eumeta variegata TaxID=151549 RepID=A0A4C1UVI2_EUMVA|nr:hypothetical protein EVAR_94683_1 [Eumeta japonica]
MRLHSGSSPMSIEKFTISKKLQESARPQPCERTAFRCFRRHGISHCRRVQRARGASAAGRRFHSRSPVYSLRVSASRAVPRAFEIVAFSNGPL